MLLLVMLLGLCSIVSAQQTGVFREVYLGIPGDLLADLTNAPAFPNAPNYTDIISNQFETPSNIGDEYGQRLRAMLVPPLTGDYTFWIASDNQGALYLSTDEAPAHKVLIASVVTWTGAREWQETRDDNYLYQRSPLIPLTAGRKYYLEALMKEKDGGDVIGVRWQLPNGLIEGPMSTTSLVPYFGEPIGAPEIVTQPASLTVIAGQSATFTVIVSNSATVDFQWLRDGVVISGANGYTYTLDDVRTEDGGSRFRCLLTNLLGSTLSAEASLTVQSDAWPPAIIEISPSRSVIVGTDLSLRASATGTAPIFYQWRFEGTNISLATNATLRLVNFQASQAGSYSVMVSNGFGSASSTNIVLAAVFGVAPAFEWVRQVVGTSSEDYGSAIASSQTGDVLIAGSYGGSASGTITFGTTTFPSSGGSDVFVARYDPDGNVLWAKTAGGPEFDEAGGVAVDAMDNCFIIGSFRGSVHFGTTNLIGSAFPAPFVAKYDQAGELMWARGLGISGTGSSITTDANGSIYVCGSSYGAGNYDVFLTKLNSQGILLWTQQIGGTGYDYGNGVTASPLGGGYIVGTLEGMMTIGGTTFYSGGFVGRFENTGNLLWARPSGVYPVGIASDPSGGSRITGRYSGDTAFGTTRLTGQGGFVASLDSSGNYQWASRLSGAGDYNSGAISTDPLGNTLVASSDYFVATRYEAVIHKYDASGRLIWLQSIHGPVDEFCSDLTLNADGTAFFTGQFYGTSTFGETNLTSSNGSDVFVAKRIPRPPALTSQPHSQNILVENPATFSVETTNSTLVTFQWEKDGSILVGQTNATLTFASAQISDSGTYTVIVSNPERSVTSLSALLSVVRFAVAVGGELLTGPIQPFFETATFELRTAFQNGTILYTLDGSPPGLESILYTGPITLNNSRTLRAITYSADFSQSFEPEPVVITVVPTYAIASSTAGGGTIHVSPAGTRHLSNTMVTAEAMAAPGWTFLQWLGDTTGTNTFTEIRMTRDKSIEAVFGTTLITAAAGSGSVLRQPNSTIYPFNSTVKLVAAPEPGQAFVLWANAVSGTNNPLSFTLTNANPSISAAFAPLNAGQFALSVLTEGFGSVSTSPRANRYVSGQVVVVTATPLPDQTFLGWSGGATGLLNPLSVVMNASKAITAHFTNRPRLTLTPGAQYYGDSGFRLWLLGEFGVRYQIEAIDGTSAWKPLAILTNAFGREQFNDWTATNTPHRLYRAVVLP